MKRRMLLLMLVLLTQLGGCAYLNTLGGDLDRRIDHWVAEREYGKALDAIDWIGPDDPRYPALQAKRHFIMKLAHTYEKEVIREADALVQQGDWDKALNLYDRALDHLPQSTVLLSGMNRLKLIQTSHSKALQHDLLLQRAKWLAQAIPVQEKLAEVNPRDADAQRHLKELKEEAREIAGQLYADGRAALKAGEVSRAQSTLALASKLDNAPKIESTLKSARNRRARSVRRARKAREKVANEKRQEVIGTTIAQYEDALGNGEYIRAQALMKKLEDLDGGDPAVKKMRVDLDKAVHKRVEHYFQEGATAYALGNFQQALGLWSRALQLEPKNSRVKERADRARRVLRNVHELRQKQGKN